jgi:putative aldouronate transport system permease protein
MTIKNKMTTFDWINYSILGLFALITLYPFIYVLAGSFNDGLDYAGGGVWLFPRKITLANYTVVMKDVAFWKAFFNTVSITIIGTVCALLVTSAVAYAMSRRELKFRGAFQWINLFAMFFSGGLIPYFLIINMLGLYDNYLVYIIPSLYSVYNMIIIQSFFKGIPEELREAAVIDGAGELRIWFTIYIPLSKPVLATVALWLATGFWNSYFNTMVYTRGGDLATLQYHLMKMIKQAKVDTGGMDPSLIEQTTSQTISFAAIIIATLPIVCVYPSIQKHFAKGVMIGSLKG